MKLGATFYEVWLQDARRKARIVYRAYRTIGIPAGRARNRLHDLMAAEGWAGISKGPTISGGQHDPRRTL